MHHPVLTHWPDAVLFDWDNTLADTWYLCWKSMNHTCDVMNHPPFTEAAFCDLPPYSIRDLMPMLFAQEAEKAQEIFLNYIQEHHLQDFRLMEGAAELITLLSQSKTYLAVVSNKQNTLLRQEVAHIGWTHFFAKIIGSGDASEDKPSSAPALEALRDSGYNPQKHDIWFVGDSHIDVICAYETGCRPIYVGIEPSPPSHPVHHFKDCKKIIEFLQDLPAQKL